MVASTHFDVKFDYGFVVPTRDALAATSEDERQEAHILDALSIVESNQTMREAKQRFSKDTSMGCDEITIETVGIHTANSSTSKETANTKESTTCTGKRSSKRQCHGAETKTQHARIKFMKSPSHLKEDVEMELKIPSNLLSHRTGSYHTGTDASSIESLSTYSEEHNFAPRHPVGEPAHSCTESVSDHDRNDMVLLEKRGSPREEKSKAKTTDEEVFLKDTRNRLRATYEQWKITQRELRENKQELAEIREKAQMVKRELKSFNMEWESQQTLLRNKDKELERLRLIIADRTLQLTEKTGELSITKVALVASENGWAACKKQVNSGNENLAKAQAVLRDLKKALSDSKAELSKTKLELDASAERRRQFSNKALRILLGNIDVGEPPSLCRYDVREVSPTRLPLRAKSWSFTHSGSFDTGHDGTPSSNQDDCPIPYSFINATRTDQVKGEKTSSNPILDDHQLKAASSTTFSSLGPEKDRPFARPTRSGNRSHDDNVVSVRQSLYCTTKKSLDTAEERAVGNIDKQEDSSLISLYFDSTSEALPTDGMITNRTDTGTEHKESYCYFDSSSKGPSASGRAMKSALVEANGVQATEISTVPSNLGFRTAHSPALGTAFDTAVGNATSRRCRSNSLEESHSIEITNSAVSHLTNPTVSEASFVTTIGFLSSQLHFVEEDDCLVRRGKKWRALMKRMKRSGVELGDGSECASLRSSDDDEVSHFSVSHTDYKMVLTGGLCTAFIAVCTMTLAYMTGALGVSYRGGILNLSDSRAIVCLTTAVLVLIVQALWNLVEETWTRVHTCF